MADDLKYKIQADDSQATAANKRVNEGLSQIGVIAPHQQYIDDPAAPR